MTPELLLAVMPRSGEKAIAFARPLTDAMDEFGIDTAQRRAAFLAQVAHESGCLRFVRELATGAAYEGRKDLGNTQPGDGIRYKGRGLLQITGRANYHHCGDALELDLVAHPEVLEVPTGACRSAGWFWKSRGLNALADADRFGELTRRINGGLNGIDERIGHWLAARKALKV